MANTTQHQPDPRTEWTMIDMPEELQDRFIDPSYVFIPPREKMCPECGDVMYLEGYDCDDHIENAYECCSCDHYEPA